MSHHEQKANYDEPFMSFDSNTPFFPTSQIRSSDASSHSQLNQGTIASFDQQPLLNCSYNQAQNSDHRMDFMTNTVPSPHFTSQLSRTSSGIAFPESSPNHHLQGTLHHCTEAASHPAFMPSAEQRIQPLPIDASMMSSQSNKGRDRHLEHQVSSGTEDTKLEWSQHGKATGKRRKIMRVTMKTSVALRPIESVQEVLGADFKDVSFNIEGALAFAGRMDKDESTGILEVYKRNTFVIDNCHYSINASASARQDSLILHHPPGTHRPIIEFALKITAHKMQDGEVGRDVGLEQFLDPKRKFKQTPQARLLAPIASEDGTLEQSWPSLTQNTSSKFCQWERVSFKKATEHNGDRRSDQSYSCICLSVIAYVPKVDERIELEEVVVARRSTPGCVVFARSPSGLRKNIQRGVKREDVEDKAMRPQTSLDKVKRESSSDARWPSSVSPNYEASPIVEQTPRRSVRLQEKDEGPTTYAHNSTETSAPTSAYPSTGFSTSHSPPTSETSPLIPGQNDFTSFDNFLDDLSAEFWHDNRAIFGE